MLRKSNITLLAAAAMLGTQAQAGLIAAWDFEGDLVEQVSSTVGTANGGAAPNGTGIAAGSSSSLDLANTTQYVHTNTNGGLGGTGSFTIITTIQTSTTADAWIFSYSPSGGVTGGADIRLLVLANGDFRIEMSSGAGFVLSGAANSFDLGDGQAHKVAAVFNSSTGDSFLDVDLYVDGTLYSVTGGTDHLVNLGSAVLTGNGGVTLGKVNYLSSKPYVGLIDDVLIYDTALTATEIDNAAVPEPASLALLGLGSLCVMRRRRA